MAFVGQTKGGKSVRFIDKKRYLWILSLTVPLVPPLTVWAYFALGENAFVTTFPMFWYFAILPVIDLMVGEDNSNPPDSVIGQLAEDQFYRILLHLSVPLFWFSLIVSAWFVGTQELPWWAYLWMAMGTGFSSGTGILVGHELGHKTNRPDQFSAKLVNAVCGYGHFCIEHNRGHHVWVATPEDPASARFNESIYAFTAREIPGTLKRGWQQERLRLEKKGSGFWSLRNDVLQGYAITLTVDLALIWAFGWIVVPFLLINNFIGWYSLTEANYVEHYGLKRQKLDNGQYEPVQPRHSWNTNHLVSNLMLFHLQRHSDHHANPMRPYQALRNFDDIPRLPAGYAGCFALAFVPSIWFSVMNPKVMEWAGDDMSKVNTGL